MNLRKFIDNLNKIDLNLFFLMSISFVLKFFNLGYADFQGDEIKALFLPDDPKKIADFLLTQRKGPIQFLITYLIKFADPGYINQLLVRLPFAIAGFFAIYYFYKLVKLHFGPKIALYSSFFLATNGFFVAFGRIAQYQSFVILFSILCLYNLSLAVTNSKYRIKGLIVSMVFWALSILSHYDGIFIFPVVLMLLVKWLKLREFGLKKKIAPLFISGALFMLLTLSFYIPFALYLSQDTKDYWGGRLTGDVSSKLSSSYYLFTVYQPIYVIHFYVACGILAALVLLLALSPKPIAKFLNKLPVVKTAYQQADKLLNGQIGITKFIIVIFWFTIAYIFWEYVVYIPGTHIYTYLMPAFILLSTGLTFAENFWLQITDKIKFIKPRLTKDIILGVIALFIIFQMYAIFVDNVKEYPWEKEKFLIWTMYPPTPIYHLSMFGFPYYRDWENIGRFIANHPEVTAYSTNERESISRHFIPIEKDTDLAGFYVYIKHPQSFTEEIPNQKALYWSSKYPPVYTMSKGGADLVNIYLMPSGTLDELKLKGL